MTPEQRAEIRNEINESLQLGIPIPTIAANLKERGIDLFEFSRQEEQVETASKSELELAAEALKKAQTQFKIVQIVSLIVVIPLLGYCFQSPVRGLIVLSTMILAWTGRAKQVKELDARFEDLSSQARLAAFESK
jgi:multidrug efflux pump subunit AcrB